EIVHARAQRFQTVETRRAAPLDLDHVIHLNAETARRAATALPSVGDRLANTRGHGILDRDLLPLGGRLRRLHLVAKTTPRIRLRRALRASQIARTRGDVEGAW